MQQLFFSADLIACSTCFGHHYAHNQELEIIIQLVAVCGRWCLVFKLSVWCGAEGCMSGLRAATAAAARKPDTQLFAVNSWPSCTSQFISLSFHSVLSDL
jgi:hypothetical protein